METLSNDELGFDSTLSSEAIDLMSEANRITDLKIAEKKQCLDEHEQALTD
jgi:hypothetical protein